MEDSTGAVPLVCIIGAGITGLATAFFLKQMGINIRVYEKESRTGGTIQTLAENGYIIDSGPNSALETTPKIQDLLTDLGIIEERVYANPVSNNRYVLRNSALHPLPMNPLKFLTSRLFSTGAKLRLCAEPFIHPLRDGPEESIADFVQRRIGREFLDYAINPFIAGVYAGNPRQLSVKYAIPKVYALEQNYGSLIKGAIGGRKERKRREEKAKPSAKLFSFIRGMEELPAALAQKLGNEISTNANITTISWNPRTKKHEISGIIKDDLQTTTADAVFLGIPACDAAGYIQLSSAELASRLRDIPYAPVALAFFGAKKSQCRNPLNGFGFLVPEVERRNILGTIWSSSLFPERAPADHIALTTFVGGTRQPELVDREDGEITEMVRDELKKIIGLEGTPSYIYIRRWQKAIPQYALGYGKVLSAIDDFEKNNPGFFIGGNFRHGISIGDCIKSSYEMAEKIRLYLKR